MSCDTISVRKVDYYVNNPFAYIIDIRDSEEFETSHIKNAINIPYENMLHALEDKRKGFNQTIRNQQEKEISRILCERTKTFIIYCDRGAMSMAICNKMSGMGYITKTVVGGFNKYNGRYVVQK